MVKQIGGIIGWVGTALVFGAVAIRFLRPEWMQYGTYMTWAGLVCILAYMLAQWRDVMTFYGTRQARYGTVSIVGILVGRRTALRRRRTRCAPRPRGAPRPAPTPESPARREIAPRARCVRRPRWPTGTGSR
jgi:hypothetical protein